MEHLWQSLKLRYNSFLKFMIIFHMTEWGHLSDLFVVSWLLWLFPSYKDVQIREIVKKQLNNFHQLNIIDDQSKQTLYPYLTDYQTDLQKLKMGYTHRYQTLKLLSLVIGLSLSYGIYTFIDRVYLGDKMPNVYNYRYSYSYSSFVATIIIMIAVIAFPILYYKMRNIPVRNSVYWPLCWWFITIILLYFMYSTGQANAVNQPTYGIMAGLLVISSLFFVSIFILSPFLSIIILINNKIIDKICPDTIFVDTILSIIAASDEVTSGRRRFKYKHEQLIRLEKAARCVERYPYRWPGGSRGTKRRLKQTHDQVAACLRHQGIVLIDSDQNSDIDFVKMMVLVLTCIVKDEWGSLLKDEQFNPEGVKPPEQFPTARILLRILRATCVAFVPLVCVWCLQKSSLALVEPARDFVISVVIIMASASFCILIDPDFSTKMSTFKDLIPFNKL